MQNIYSMKTIKFILTILLAAVLFHACTSSFEDINTNPNQLTVGQIQAIGVFEPILYDGANQWLNRTWFWNNELVQFTVFSGGTTREEHRYFISDGNFSNWWNFNADYANNSLHMYELAEHEDNAALKAIALTWKVFYLSNQTDIFGDIPYSEAFQARSTGNTKPKFDSQKEVYKQMFAELETANTLYAGAQDLSDATRDKMYGGDISQWQKFSNSLYLRLLMRVSGRSEMSSAAKIQTIVNDPSQYPIFVSNADNATVSFSGESPYVNYFGSTTESNFTKSGRHLAEQTIKMMVLTNDANQTLVDPRLPIIGKTNNSGNTWKGAVAGGTIEETTSSNSGASLLNFEVFCRENAAYTFMDYAEVEFILAEAALKGIITGGNAAAKSYYEAGITVSMQKWSDLGIFNSSAISITDLEIADFLQFQGVQFDTNASQAKLEELIANQKYVALFWIGIEAWHEYRRTGYPELIIGAGTLNDHILPTRFAYPSVTMATNSDNANEALENMGGDNDMQTPVWWSKQAIN